MPYLNKETKANLSRVRVSEYPLPYEPDTLVRIKSQPMARMNRYAEAVQTGGDRAKQDTYKLLAESVIDEADEQVFDPKEIQELAQADTRLVTALIKMVTKHNGGGDQDVEEIMGNL